MAIATGQPFDLLSQQLKINRFRNSHGRYEMDFTRIPGLKILARTTNGSSGICRWRGFKIYFWYSYSEDRFVIETY